MLQDYRRSKYPTDMFEGQSTRPVAIGSEGYKLIKIFTSY